VRAAIYSRFSTDRQTESSIADQVRVCTEYAAANGMTITHRFEDQGISGAAIGNRPGCVAMLDAAKAQAFDVLLVMDTSRLSRSSADLSKIADRLVFMGLRIVAVQEPGADTSKDGWEIYFGLSGLMGQQFRKMTGKKTHTALESRAKVGKATGGRCYGYTSKNEPVASEAAIVAELFQRRANGEGLRTLVRDLNARAVPTPHGRPWAVSGVHAMLRNERYLGRLTWNRSMWRKDPDSGKRIRVERPESERITHTDERLRLVSDATWQRVRSHDAPLADGRAPDGKQNRQARLRAPLSGLLVCGSCGKPMTLAGGVNSRGMGSRRYVCRTFKEHKDAPGYGCSNNVTVSRAVAEELIIDPLRERLASDPQWTKALAAFLAQREEAQALQWKHIMGELVAPPAMDNDPAAEAALAAKLEALKAAELAGVLTAREARERAAAFRGEHKRAKAGHLPGDPAAILAHAEALQTALESAATDALREALRGVLGSVRCQPVTDDGKPYLHAQFEGGDMPLLSWLAVGSAGNNEGISALVAGAGFEPATFGL
jgi:site-specific DNA recombinase